MSTRNWSFVARADTRRLVIVAGFLVGLLLAPAAAVATAPGQNGQIAFRRYLGPNRTKGAIFVAARDGTGERQLTTAPGSASDDFPDMAPDGSFVAFQRCGPNTCGVYVINTDGSGLRRVDDGCGRLPPRCTDNSYPAISPDGRQIAFNRAFGRIRNDQIDHSGIYRMRIDGSRIRRVSLPATRTAEDIEPQWSPDGKQIVFVRHNASAKPAGAQAVFVINADGTARRRVTPYGIKAGDGPDWSPDGSQILFRSPETEDFLDCDIWTIHPDGTGLRQVTHAGARTKVYSASFSPDGTAITLGMTGVNGQADVFTIGTDGTGLAPVTRSPSWDSAPDWGGTATVAAAAASPEVKLSVRAAVLTRSADGSWDGAALSAQLGRGQMTLTGRVIFPPDTEPSHSVLRFRVTFKKGWVRGCVHNTVLMRPGNRYVWDGPGRITSTSSSLRRYRGIKVYDGGVTMTDDLTHAKPFRFDSPVPPPARRADTRC
jgi:TolB protein